MKKPSWKNVIVSVIYFILFALLAAERFESGHELAGILIGGVGIGLPAGFLFVMYPKFWTAQSMVVRVAYIIALTAAIALAKLNGTALDAILTAGIGIGLPVGFVFFVSRRDRQA